MVYCIQMKKGMSRLEALMEEDLYNEVSSYMKEHNVKLEQEIVSYYLELERSSRNGVSFN